MIVQFLKSKLKELVRCSRIKSVRVVALFMAVILIINGVDIPVYAIVAGENTSTGISDVQTAPIEVIKEGFEGENVDKIPTVDFHDAEQGENIPGADVTVTVDNDGAVEQINLENNNSENVNPEELIPEIQEGSDASEETTNLDTEGEEIDESTTNPSETEGVESVEDAIPTEEEIAAKLSAAKEDLEESSEKCGDSITDIKFINSTDSNQTIKTTDLIDKIIFPEKIQITVCHRTIAKRAVDSNSKTDKSASETDLENDVQKKQKTDSKTDIENETEDATIEETEQETVAGEELEAEGENTRLTEEYETKEVGVKWGFDAENSTQVEQDLREMEDLSLLTDKSVAVYNAELVWDDEQEIELDESVAMPTLTIKISDSPAFEDSVTVNGVTITVNADEGVFPENVSVEAEEIDILEELLNEYELQDTECLNGVIREYDIRVIDEEGVEVEPNNKKGEVHVAFSNPTPNGSFDNSDWKIYHVNDEDMVVEELQTETNTEFGEISATTESFSSYVISAKNYPSPTTIYDISEGTLRIASGNNAETEFSVTGKAQEYSLTLANTSGKECTFRVFLDKCKINRNSEKKDAFVIETNGYKTNVYLYLNGDNTFSTSKRKPFRKTGDGAVTVYFDSFDTNSSSLYVEQSNWFSDIDPLDASIDYKIVPNGAKFNTGLGSYAKAFYSFDQLIAYGKNCDSFDNITIYLIGRNKLYIDKNGKGFNSSGNINGELVGANSTVILPEPEHRPGYIFEGYSIRRPLIIYLIGSPIDLGMWDAWSGPIYKPGDKLQIDNGDLQVKAEYSQVQNTVSVDLRLDDEIWSGQDVKLVDKSKEYQLTEKNGQYVNTSVVNGNYDLKVNGESSGHIIAVAADQVSVPVYETVAYTKTGVNIKLDDVSSSDVGAVTLRKDNSIVYELNGTNGVYEEIVSNTKLPLNVFVDDKDTGYAVSASADTRNQTIDFYNMNVTINDDAPWKNASVVLEYASGLTAAEPTVKEVNGNSVTYSSILQKNTADEAVCKVLINDKDTDKTIAPVSASHETSVDYYSAKVTIESAHPDAPFVTMTNGLDSYTLIHNSTLSNPGVENVYSVDHVIKRFEAGDNEIDYTLNVDSVIDATENIVNSGNKDVVLTYRTIKFHNSKNDGEAGLGGEEEDNVLRTLFARDNSLIPQYTGNVVRAGYTFNYWSDVKWDPDKSYEDCPKYDFSTPVSQNVDLYAVYAKPSIKIGEPIFTDENGHIGGNGQYYRMGNLTVEGFDTADESIKYIQLEVTNATNVRIINADELGDKCKVTSGGATVNLTGDYADIPAGDTTKITFEFNPPVSMGMTQDVLRNNIVVSPKENETHTLSVTVFDKNGKFIAANKVTDPKTVGYSLPENAKSLDDMSSGQTLKSGTYYLKQDKEFGNSSSGTNGLKIASNATVYIYIPSGVTLTAYGKNGSGTAGGYAGILVPSGSTLNIIGEGTIVAKGGNAGNGAKGGNGTNASVKNDPGDNSVITSGYGGSGGVGGGGAGAGIGTDGATANTTPAGGGKPWEGSIKVNRRERSNVGNPGSDSIQAQNAGTINIASGINRSDVVGGFAGSGGNGGTAGKGLYGDTKIDIDTTVNNRKHVCAGGSGGGGGGGGGYAGAAVGTGGASGAGGSGGGGGGLWVVRGERTFSHGVGGVAGPGGNEGKNGATVPKNSCILYTGVSEQRGNEYYFGYTNSARDTKGEDTDASKVYGAKSGAAGVKGTGSAGTNAPSVSCKIKYDTSSSDTVTGEYPERAYSFGGESITLPEYQNSDRNVNFLGWEVKTAAGNFDSNANFTKTGVRYQGGTSYNIAVGTYGDIELVAITETAGGISSNDSILEYEYISTNPEKEYTDYKVKLTCDGVVAPKGTIKIGNDSVAPSEDGTYVLTVPTDSAEPRAIYVKDENTRIEANAGQETEVPYSSVKVTVKGIIPNSVSLKGSGAPVITECEKGTDYVIYKYETLASNATTGEYSVFVDSKDTKVKVKYSEPATVDYFTNTINVYTNGFSATKIGNVELRNEAGSRLFAKCESATDECAVFSITNCKDESEYSVFVDGVKAAELTTESGSVQTISFKDKNQSVSVNKRAYTTVIRTFLNGELADIGSVVLGDNTQYNMLRSAKGVYSYVFTQEIEGNVLPLSIAGREVCDAQQIGITTDYNYYTIAYDQSESIGELPKDKNIYLSGDEVTILSGSRLSCGGKTFAGWEIAPSDNVYKEGEKLNITQQLTAYAKWEGTDFATESEDFRFELSTGSFTYNGKVQTPTIALYRGTLALKEGVDYDLTYVNTNTGNGHNDPAGGKNNSINAGTVTVTATGKGDYKGSFRADYMILPKEISVGGLEAIDREYNGSKDVELTTDKAYFIGTIAGDDVEFASGVTGSAYSANANNNIPVSVSNTELGGAAGSNYTLKTNDTLYVNITPKNLTADIFTLKTSKDGEAVTDSTYAYNGEPQEPYVVATDNQTVDGQIQNIISEENYKISYLNNVNAGTCTVRISADVLTDEEKASGEITNYAGAVDLPFKINPRSIKVAASAGQSAYGKPVDESLLSYTITDMDGNPVNISDEDMQMLDIKTYTTVKSGYKVGTYPNSVSVSYNKDCKNYDITVINADYTVTKTDDPIPVTVKNYIGKYDGQYHGIDISIDANDSTAIVYYSLTGELNASNYTSATPVSFGEPVPDTVKRKDAGNVTVYYYITSNYYKAVAGSAVVRLSKATLDVTAVDRSIEYGSDIAGVSGKYVYDETAGAAGGYTSATYSDVIITGWSSKEDANSADNQVFSFTSDGYRKGDSVLTAGQYYDIIPKRDDSVLSVGVWKNYDVVFHYGKLSVVPKKVTFNWPKTTFEYNGYEQSVNAEIVGVLNEDKASVKPAYDTNSAVNAGTYTAKVTSLSGLFAGNYTIEPGESTAQTDWEITKATNGWAITPSIDSYTVDASGNIPQVTPVGVAKYGNVTFKYREAAATQGTETGSLPTTPGSYVMVASVAETGNYTELSEQVRFIVIANTKPIVYVSPRNTEIAYGDSLSNIFVDYKLADGSDADNTKISGSLLYNTDYNLSSLSSRSVGDYTISVSGATSSDYELIYKSATLTVKPKKVTFKSPDETEFNYDGKKHGVELLFTSDSLFDDDTVSIEYESEGTNVNEAINVGNYKAKVKRLIGEASRNYEIDSDTDSCDWKIKKAQSVTFTVAPHIDNWYYGDNAPTPVGMSSAGEVTFKYKKNASGIADWPIFNWKSAQVPTEPGEYELIAEVEVDGGKVSSEPVSFTIYKAQVTVAANNKSCSYKGSREDLTYSITVSKGKLSQYEINALKNKITLSCAAVDNADCPPGTYPVEVSANESDLAEISTINGKYEVTNAAIEWEGKEDEKPLVENVTVEYDGQSHSVKLNEFDGASEGKVTVYYSTETSLSEENYGSGTTTLPSVKDAGVLNVYYYAAGDGFVPVSGLATLTINKKSATIKATNDSIVYSDAAPVYSASPYEHVTAEGLAEGDSLASLNVPVSFKIGREDTSVSPATWQDYSSSSDSGEYIIRPDVSSATGNYNFTCEDGVLTVGKLSLNNIKVNGLSGDILFKDAFVLKEGGSVVNDSTYTYDKTPKTPTVTRDSAVLSQLHLPGEANPDIEVSYESNENAGIAKVTVNATDSGNYTGSLTGAFTINKRRIVYRTSPASSYYNQPIAELSCSISEGSIIPGDEDSLDIRPTTTVKKGNPVGVYPDAITVSYRENPNYVVEAYRSAYEVKAAKLNVTSNGYEGLYDGENHTGSVVAKTGKFLTSATVYYSDSVSLSDTNYSTQGSTRVPEYKNVEYDNSGNVKTHTIYYIVVCDNFDSVTGSFDVKINPRKIMLNWTLDDADTSVITATGEAQNHSLKVAFDESEVVRGDSLAVTQLSVYRNSETEPFATKTEGTYDFSASTSISAGNLEPGEYRAKATLTGEGATNYVIYSSAKNFIINSDSSAKKENSFITPLSAPSWSYGQAHLNASAEAKYGEVLYEYYSDYSNNVKTSPDNGGAEAEGRRPVLPGSYVVKAYVSETSEYTAISDTKEFTISKCDMHIIAGDVSSVCGEKLPDISNAYTKDKDFLKSTDAKVKVSTTATKNSPIGEYPINVEIESTDSNYPFTYDSSHSVYENEKYKITVVPGTMFITGAENVLNVSATGYSGEYDGTGHTINVSVKDKSGKPVNDATVYYAQQPLSDSNYGIGSTFCPAITNAGNTTIYYFVESDKYAPVSGSKDISISKKDVTVTAENAEITYGDVCPSAGRVKTLGFVGSDSLESLGVHPTVRFDYAQYEAAGTYDIKPVLSDDANNYNFILNNGALTVKPRLVSFRWSDLEFEYTGLEQSVVATPYEILNGDDVASDLSGGTAIGTGAYVATVTALSGADADNYTFDPDDSASKRNWKITGVANGFVKALTIKDWTYGEQPSEPSAQAMFGDVTYKYFSDELCDVPTNTELTGSTACGAETEGGRPTLPGDYYVKAYVEATQETGALTSDPVIFTINQSKVIIKAEDVYATTSDDEKELKYTVSGTVASDNPINVSLALEPSADITAEGDYEIIPTISNDRNIFLVANDGITYKNREYLVTVLSGTYYVSNDGFAVSSDKYEGEYDGNYHQIAVNVTPGKTSAGDDKEYKVYYSTVAATDSQKEEMKNATSAFAKSSPSLRYAGLTPVYYYVVSDGKLYEGESFVNITPANLTIKAKDTQIFEGNAPKCEGVDCTGFADGESESNLNGTLKYSYTYSVGNPAGEYEITPFGLNSSNYDITFVPGKLTVKEVPGEVTVTYTDGQSPATETFMSLEEALEKVEDRGNPSPVTIEITKSPIKVNGPLTIPDNVTVKVPAGEKLEISEGGELTNNGTLDNDGTVGNEGTIKNNGTLDNDGTVDNEGTFDNDSDLINRGTINNKNVINNNGEIDNDGDITNRNVLNNTGTFNNGGTLDNKPSSTLTNDGTIVNETNGTLTNDGTVDNNSTGTVDNDGTINNKNVFNNDGSIDNDGDLINRKVLNNSGTLDNDGTVDNDGKLNNTGNVMNKGTVDNGLSSTIVNSGDISNSVPGVLTNNGNFDNTNGTINKAAGSDGKVENKGTISGGDINGPMVNESTGKIDKPSKITGDIENKGTVNVLPSTDTSGANIDNKSGSKYEIIKNPTPSPSPTAAPKRDDNAPGVDNPYVIPAIGGGKIGDDSASSDGNDGGSNAQNTAFAGENTADTVAVGALQNVVPGIEEMAGANNAQRTSADRNGNNGGGNDAAGGSDVKEGVAKKDYAEDSGKPVDMATTEVKYGDGEIVVSLADKTTEDAAKAYIEALGLTDATQAPVSVNKLEEILSAALDENELEKVKSGESANIGMCVVERKITAEDVGELSKSYPQFGCIKTFTPIISKKLGDEKATILKNWNNSVAVTMDVPKEFEEEGRQIIVLAKIEGKWQPIASVYDVENGTISFETNSNVEYMLGYFDGTLGELTSITNGETDGEPIEEDGCIYHWFMLAIVVAAAILNAILRGIARKKKRIISDCIAVVLAVVVALMGECNWEYVIGVAGVVFIIVERLVLRKNEFEEY